MAVHSEIRRKNSQINWHHELGLLRAKKVRSTYPDHSVEREGSHEGATGGHAVRRQQLFLADWRLAGPVGVVDQGVERLIDPLPEDDGRRRLVEGHHAPGDGHVHRDLGGHAAHEQHLLAGVRMECTVVQVLGGP